MEKIITVILLIRQDPEPFISDPSKEFLYCSHENELKCLGNRFIFKELQSLTKYRES